MSKALTLTTIAMVCHEANRAFCAALGDTSHARWVASPENLQQSVINGVKFNVANPDAPASASHESWLAEKERDGWTYGEVKDFNKKTHPCFVPYDELPIEQQAKDHMFKGIVGALAPLLGADEVREVLAGYGYLPEKEPINPEHLELPSGAFGQRPADTYQQSDTPVVGNTDQAG